MILLKKLVILFLCSAGIISFSYTLLHNSSVKAVNSTGTDISSDFPIIIIDAGHGGFDGGAVSVDGTPEKNINLSVSLYLKDILDFYGYKTMLTRSEDVSLEDKGITSIKDKKTSDIHNRLKLMDDTDNCIFISIHQNFFTEEKYSGAQVFYSPGQREESTLLAQCIQSSVTDNLQPNNTRQIKECGTSVYLIYNAVKPAVLVECGFLSNIKEAGLLKTENYQKKTAYCIAMGIMDYCSK